MGCDAGARVAICCWWRVLKGDGEQDNVARPAMEYGEIGHWGTLHGGEMEKENSRDAEIHQEGSLQMRCLQPDGETAQEESSNVVNVLHLGSTKWEEIEAAHHERCQHEHQATLTWLRNQ